MFDFWLATIEACTAFIRIEFDGAGTVIDGIEEVVIRKNGEHCAKISIDRDFFEVLVEDAQKPYVKNPTLRFIGAEPIKEGV